MKRLLLIVTGMLLCFACTEPNEGRRPQQPESVLAVSPGELVFTSSERTGQRIIVASNTEWKITVDAAWLTVSPSEGNAEESNVSIKVSENQNPEDRNAILTITAGNRTKTAMITQKGKDAIIASKDKFEMPKQGGEFSVDLKYNTDYQVRIYDSWITEVATRSLDSRTRTFTVSKNTSASQRTGQIKFVGENTSETITVYQAEGDALILQERDIRVGFKGETVTVDLRTNVAYDVMIPADAQTWITEIDDQREDRITLEIAANPSETEERSATITVKDRNGSLSDKFTITQEVNGLSEGDIELKSEADIEALYEAGTKTIVGNLTISGSEITSLAKLENLIIKVSGNLMLDLPECISLTGLGNLAEIGGDLIVKADKIESFNGLNSLRTIGGDFAIYDSAAELVSFEGLENLETVSGGFRLLRAPDNGTDRIGVFGSLTSFAGLGSLKTIGGDFEIYESATALKSFEGLENLTSIAGNFRMACAKELNYSSYNFKHDYTPFESFASFNGLESLRTIGGDFLIEETIEHVRSFEGLESLESIGGSFRITTLSSAIDTGKDRVFALESFAGLNSLKTIGGGFELNGNTLLTPIFGSLKSFEGLESLESIAGDFRIGHTCIQIESFQGLNSLKTIGGEVYLSDYFNSLVSFEGLENLETIGKGFMLDIPFQGSMNSLKTFKGLDGLKSIGGDFIMQYLPRSSKHPSFSSLVSFEGLENLETIAGDFRIDAYRSFNVLRSFNGLNTLKEIGGNFEIRSFAVDTENDISGSINSFESLTSFAGLESLEKIGGDFIIMSNNGLGTSLGKLESFDGLDNLKSIGGNFSIEVLMATTGSDTTELESLKSFKGLENLETIGGNFSIYGYENSGSTALESLTGLENLKTIGKGNGNLGIEYCKYLTDISAFDGLESVLHDININHCDRLLDFSPLRQAVEKMTGEWKVSECGYNPTKEQMLDGQCSPQE